MKISEYLNSVLASQGLGDDSEELKALQLHRKEVEAVVRERFKDSSPTIRYGGSKAKGTLIRESYDLDIICYFPSGESAAGETLKEIYENVKDLLAKHYYVEPRTSALRIMSNEQSEVAPRDFHIDVVPGRFTDASKSDCYIYLASGEKDRLKTNLDVHLEYVQDSGVLDAIRLLKLWKVRRRLNLKNFVFELMIIKLLADEPPSSLSEKLELVWMALRDRKDPVGVEDPANPQGNDLSPLLHDAWPSLKAAATDTLTVVKTLGWASVFGEVEEHGKEEKVRKLQAAAAAVTTPTKPWCPST